MPSPIPFVRPNATRPGPAILPTTRVHSYRMEPRPTGCGRGFGSRRWGFLRAVLSFVTVRKMQLEGPGVRRTEAAAIKPPRGRAIQLVDPDNQALPGTAQSPEGVLNVSGSTCFGGTIWDATEARWEAVSGGMWTFDSGVGSSFNYSTPGVDPYKYGSPTNPAPPGQELHALMEGWIGIDLTRSQGATYFRRMGVSDFAGPACVGSAVGLGGNWSFWVGLTAAEAAYACYQTGRGYGNNWDTSISKVFNYNGTDNVTLSFKYNLNTDNYRDVIRVEVEDVSAGTTKLVAFGTGVSAGSYTKILKPGTDLPTVAGPIRIRFRFVSDATGSDEDGGYPTTCGAFAVDDISVTSPSLSFFDNFEAGSDGWALDPPQPGAGGDWSDIVELSTLPPPLVSGSCAMAGSVLVFQDLAVGGHGTYQDNIAASPWIDLLQAGMVGSAYDYVKYDYYSETPIKNYIFAQVLVQWYPYTSCPAGPTTAASPWKSNGFVYYYSNSPSCSASGGPQAKADFTGIIDPTAEAVRIGLGVVNYCRFYTGSCTGFTNSTPWFDNVCFEVSTSPCVPVLALRPFDLPQDAFPENGTLRLDAPGRLDSGYITGDTGPVAGSALGDTLVVRGGLGEAEVRVQFALHPGPGINTVQLNTWLSGQTYEGVHDGQSWYSARMDTAEVGGVAFTGYWMTAYHEQDPNFTGTDTDVDPTDYGPTGLLTHLANDIFPDDLFTPGSRVCLFYKAREIGTLSWSTAPDTTGGNCLEWECLPSSMGPDSTFNCVLYVDDADGRGAQPYVEGALASLLGTGSVSSNQDSEVGS